MKYNRLLALIVLILLAAGVCFCVNKFYFSKTITSTVESQNMAGKNGKIWAAIVPHHDLDKTDRAEMLSKIKDGVSAKTVILVSTNHFNTGNSNIITTTKKWEITDGTISTNENVINALTDSGLAANDESAFSQEHGITNILPDMAKYFPKKNIVPIIIKPGTKEEDLSRLSDKLVESCGSDCFLLASVDFSHYQPGALAEVHDDLSIRALKSLNAETLKRAEVDSIESLFLTIKWARAHKTEDFNLYKNTNSDKIDNNRDAESTSYVLGYYEEGQKAEQNNSFTFMIGGDMMFDRNIEYHFQGNKLADVMKNFGNRVFSGTDLSLVNLEGPISPTILVPESNHSMVFNFQPNTVDVLSSLGINAVSLANNHTLNNGAKGLANTKKVLIDKGISYIGQDAIFNNESVKTFKNGSGIKLSVITIDCLNTSTDIRDQIKEQKNLGNLVLVFPHWGTEYEQTHSKSQENLAHAWIDAGADFVFGGHPHVIQDAEVYKGKPIFYSLGNLLFDQDFSPETQRGLVVAVKITKNATCLVLLPAISKNYQPQLLSGTEKTSFLKKFRMFLGAPEIDQKYGYDIIELQR